MYEKDIVKLLLFVFVRFCNDVVQRYKKHNDRKQVLPEGRHDLHDCDQND